MMTLANGRHRMLIFALLILLGLALHLILWAYSEPPYLFGDFYKAYFPAAQRVWELGPRDAFQHLEVGVGGFVNMPILVWSFVPLLAFGYAGAGWAFCAIGIASVIAAWWLLARMADPATHIAPVLAFLFLVDGPMVNSLREGNSTHIVLFLLVLALTTWRGGLHFSTGLILGLAALIKIPFLLFGVYFLLRGNWRIVAGGVSMLAAAFALSLAVHGLQVNIAWFDGNVLAYVGRVIPAFNVQSIDAFLMRLSTGPEALFDWTAREPTGAHRVARWLIFIVLFGAIIWLMRRARRQPEAELRSGTLTSRDYLEYCTILLLAIVVSPVSWSHYYLFALLPIGLYLGKRLPLPDDGITRWLMWLGFVLTALPIVLMPLEPDWVLTLASRTILSAWLFGGLLMLVGLMRGLYYLPIARDRPA
ncbi:MAG: glycosyltransferase family 87 protein [Hyphomicrobiales bacterium]